MRVLVCVCIPRRAAQWLVMRNWRWAPASRLLGGGTSIRHLLSPPRFQIEYDSETPELRLFVRVSYRGKCL